MRRLFFIVLVFVVALVVPHGRVSAQVQPLEPAVYYLSHVNVDNRSDSGAWITAYRGTIIGKQIIRAWCVPPRTQHKETIMAKVGFGVDYVRLEVTQPNCGHPVRLDRTYDFMRRTFILTGKEGKYSITELYKGK